MELDKAIKERRAIREFTDYVVSNQELENIFEAVRLSPSWANFQPWSFIVVRDKKTIEQIDERAKAPTLVVALAKKDISGVLRGKETTKFKEWFMFDLGIAVYGFCLKAYELGFGTVIFGNVLHDKIRDMLKVPHDYEVVAVVPLGKPAENPTMPSRKKIKEILFFEKFGQN
jgi:nitroreductase